MAMWSNSHGSNVDVLCTLCRRELALVESYRQALSSDNLREHAAELATCLRSHEQRAELLKSRIRALHAEPPDSAGARGALVRMVEGAAAAFGARAAIFALEEEEERELRHYRGKVEALDPDSRQLLQEQVVPAQVETHRMISELKHTREAALRSN